MSNKASNEELELRVKALEEKASKFKQIETTLLENEERFRLLYERAPLGYQSLDENGFFLEVNQAWLDTLGYNRDEVIGRSFGDFLLPEWQGHFKKNFPKFKAVGEILGVEFHMVRKDGTTIMVMFNGNIGRHPDGSFKQTHCILRDITERKKEEDALQIAHDELETRVEGRTDELSRSNKKLQDEIAERKRIEEIRSKILARQQQINHLQEYLLGSGSLAEKMKSITDNVVSSFGADFCRIWIVGPGDLCESGCIHGAETIESGNCKTRFSCLHLAASSGRYTHIDGGHRRIPIGSFKIGRLASDPHAKFLTNNVANDQQIHHHEWARELGLKSFAGYQLRDVRGETVGVLALFSKHVIEPEEDVMLESLGNSTAQVIQTSMAESNLRQSEKKYRILLENLPQKIFHKDDNSVYISCNEHYAEDLKIEPDKIAGTTDYDYYPSELAEKYIKDDQRIVETGKGEDIVEEYVVDGCSFWVHTVKTPLRDDHGNVAGVLGIFRDITDLKKMEDEKEQLITELQAALNEVKTLKGILPLCSFCKKIRDEKGHWEQVDTYIHKHAGADVSHGICPECLKKHYPGICEED